VDDGLATGRSARAAVESVRRRGAARVVLAVPVAAPGSIAALGDCIDDAVCVQAPADLRAIGMWYAEFRPTSDREVQALLGQYGVGPKHRAAEVAIEAGPGILLAADLTLPPAARGIVAFAHGSGSSRASPRNRSVADVLADLGFGSLLLDLLTPAEEIDRANVFDIPLLAQRLVAATDWLSEQPETQQLPLGGASTGAAAALLAAAQVGAHVGAVVCRGGRPDIALGWLDQVSSPTLLIVGGYDTEVLEYNREAQGHLICPNRMAVVAGATHLFGEPGAMDEVARLAGDWFERHLPAAGPDALAAAH
jgi:putative phosphoribosyl transferase